MEKGDRCTVVFSVGEIESGSSPLRSRRQGMREKAEERAAFKKFE